MRTDAGAHPCIYFLGPNDSLVAELENPIFGLASGQAMVIYEDDRVVGSATVAETA